MRWGSLLVDLLAESLVVGKVAENDIVNQLVFSVRGWMSGIGVFKTLRDVRGLLWGSHLRNEIFEKS